MSSGSVVRLRSLLLVGMLCALVFVPGQHAMAVDSVIRTTVCNPSASPTSQVTIDQPVNDTVVNVPTVTLSGAAIDVSQVDIEVDGTYSQTMAIASGQSMYSTNVQLLPGTHTITVTGVDMCGASNPSASTVITYQPNTQPSNGGDTPTVPAGGAPTVGPPSSAPNQPAEAAEWVQNIPLLPGAIEVIEKVGRALDIDESGNGNIWKGGARFLLFTLGAVLLLGGPWLLARLEGREKFQASVSRYMETGMRTSAVVSHLRRNSWLMRGFGAALILLAFAI